MGDITDENSYIVYTIATSIESDAIVNTAITATVPMVYRFTNLDTTEGVVNFYRKDSQPIKYAFSSSDSLPLNYSTETTGNLSVSIPASALTGEVVYFTVYSDSKITGTISFINTDDAQILLPLSTRT